jgi:pimeloyl-ACP methyl ester carboxylesterase
MAKVVLVHGAFNELWGPHELKARWFPAVQDGLWHHGVAIDPDEVAVCFYGDLYRLDLSQTTEEEWKAQRAGAEELLSEFGGDNGLDFLSQAAGKYAYDRTIDMMTVMTSQPTVRRDSRRRLLDVISPQTRVIIGHSMGSVISHQTLALNPDIEVDTLITLGSPLGSEYVFPMLQGEAADGSGPWPGSTRRWVNVAAHGDQAAAVSRLSEKFGERVEDHLIDNGYRAHDPEPYLNSAVTGAALAAALATPS